MKLVDDWKQGWKWLSVHIAVVISALNGAVAASAYMQTILPPTTMNYINAVLGIALIGARLVNQGISNANTQ